MKVSKGYWAWEIQKTILSMKDTVVEASYVRYKRIQSQYDLRKMLMSVGDI